MKYILENNKSLKTDLNQGFTLIEIIVVIAGFTLIVWGMIGLFSGLFTASNQQSGLLADTDQARQVGAAIATELRNGQTGSNGAYVLDTAGSQSLIFYSTIGNSAAIDRLRYFVQNNQLWEGITYYNGSTYNTSTEQTILVQKDLANGANPLFYYYDGSYIGSSTQASLTQPVNVTAVKFVKVQIQIYNKAGVSNTNTYTVTTGATIRNLKTNLGS